MWQIRLRGHASIIHMEDYEIGDDYVYMVMECGEQVCVCVCVCSMYGHAWIIHMEDYEIGDDYV